MDPLPHFSAGYAEARDKFVAAARARRATAETHVLPGRRGAGGEELAIDVALFGAAASPAMLIVTSATHGIEGYCGSGVQTALLHDDDFVAHVRRAGVALLLVHAVNPYGFSHGRRVNEDNVDLNRNFRDFGKPLPANPAYAGIHPWLVPAAWPPPQDNEAKIAEYIGAHGQRAFQAALTGGQHEFPGGLFYGGAGPAWSNATVRAVLQRHAASRQRLGWIDVHTGLGPRGHGEKIYAGRDAPDELARARRWWGDDVTSYYEGSSTSANVTGVITSAAFDECPGAEISAIGLEFGTRPLPEVFHALRGDHWLHAHPDATPATRAAIEGAMRKAFHDEADDWKATVTAQGRAAALAAVDALAASGGGR